MLRIRHLWLGRRLKLFYREHSSSHIVCPGLFPDVQVCSGKMDEDAWDLQSFSDGLKENCCNSMTICTSKLLKTGWNSSPDIKFEDKHPDPNNFLPVAQIKERCCESSWQGRIAPPPGSLTQELMDSQAGDELSESVRKLFEVSMMHRHCVSDQPRFQIRGCLVHKERRTHMLSLLPRRNMLQQNFPAENSTPQVDIARLQINEDGSLKPLQKDDSQLIQASLTGDGEPQFKIKVGDGEELHQKILCEEDNMKKGVTMMHRHCVSDQPRFQIRGCLVHKERRTHMLSLLPRRNMSQQNFPAENSTPQVDIASLQINEDGSLKPLQKDDSQLIQASLTEDGEPPFKIEVGDGEELHQKILREEENMKMKVNNFKDKYRTLRHLFASRGLIAPHDLKHPSTLFLYKQTFRILNQNPSYIGSFDIMSYEDGVRSKEEWEYFLHHLVMKRIYVIEDWESTISTVEILLYDHGIVEPKDGTAFEFFKGECDASFANNKARLSFIIWKGDKIFYSEVIKGISCSSATQAEAYAAFALLSKAMDLKILKLLVCSDCLPVCEILSGELGIGMNHKHRDLYMMLRSMKRHFDKLVVMWKPRELMFFVDDLAKASDIELVSPLSLLPTELLQRWSHHLQGLPLFRIERAADVNKRIRKFVEIEIDESYGQNDDSVFFIEVHPQDKIACLIGLKQSFVPKAFSVCISNYEKSDYLYSELDKVIGGIIESKSEKYSILHGSTQAFTDKFLVVVFDAAIPRAEYFHSGAFHIILVSPDERNIMMEKRIPEMNALTFVYFNGVKFPLNDKSADAKRSVGEGRKDHREQKVLDEGTTGDA